MTKVKIPREDRIYDVDGLWLRAACVCVKDHSETEVSLSLVFTNHFHVEFCNEHLSANLVYLGHLTSSDLGTLYLGPSPSKFPSTAFLDFFQSLIVSSKHDNSSR